MHQDILLSLEQYGLSEKEAKIYVATLELGSAPASTIARRTNIKRVTVYTLLKELESKGICQSITRNDVKYFSVSKPEFLAQELEEKHQRFSKILPELMALANAYDNRPKIRYYEWFEWLKQTFEDVLSHSKHMDKDEYFLSFLWTSGIDPQFHKYLETEFIKDRKEQKAKTKIIIAKANQTLYAKQNQKLHESLVIDHPRFTLANEIVIYGTNKVAVLMFGKDEMAGITIESKSLHEWLENMFYLIRDAYGDRK